jgi:hypothetical protein
MFDSANADEQAMPSAADNTSLEETGVGHEAERTLNTTTETMATTKQVAKGAGADLSPVIEVNNLTRKNTCIRTDDHQRRPRMPFRDLELKHSNAISGVTARQQSKRDDKAAAVSNLAKNNNVAGCLSPNANESTAPVKQRKRRSGEMLQRKGIDKTSSLPSHTTGGSLAGRQRRRRNRLLASSIVEVDSSVKHKRHKRLMSTSSCRDRKPLARATEVETKADAEGLDFDDTFHFMDERGTYQPPPPNLNMDGVPKLNFNPNMQVPTEIVLHPPNRDEHRRDMDVTPKKGALVDDVSPLPDEAEPTPEVSKGRVEAAVGRTRNKSNKREPVPDGKYRHRKEREAVQHQVLDETTPVQRGRECHERGKDSCRVSGKPIGLPKECVNDLLVPKEFGSTQDAKAFLKVDSAAGAPHAAPCGDCFDFAAPPKAMTPPAGSETHLDIRQQVSPSGVKNDVQGMVLGDGLFRSLL